MSYFDALVHSGSAWWDSIHHRLILVDDEYQLWVSQDGRLERWHVCFGCEHAGRAEDFFHPSHDGHCRNCGMLYHPHA